MPDSLGPDSPETGSSMPPGGPPLGANVGGAGAPPPQGGPVNLPPQGAPANQSAQALGQQAQARDIVRKVLIPGLEKAFTLLGGSMNPDGEAIFRAIGTLSKHFGKEKEGQNEALLASMRQQMTRKPVGVAPGGAPPAPPPGPVPAPQAGPA